MAEMNDGTTPTLDGVVRLDMQGEPGENVRVSLRCHPGAVRAENQDRVSTAATPLGRFVLVADGIGGEAGGAETAELAAVEYVRFLQATASSTAPGEALAQATGLVSAEIESRRASQQSPQGMGSTVAVLLVRGHEAFVGHVGDSRVYLARQGQLRCLTRDHSVVRRMVDHGIISAEEAESHPKAHLLTQSLGTPGATMEVSASPLQTGDVLLLCSDGLWAYVPEAKLQEVLTSGVDASRAADELLQLALQADAPDNVSVAVVAVEVVTAPSAPVGKGMGRGRLWLLLLLALLVVAGIATWQILQRKADSQPHIAPIRRGAIATEPSDRPIESAR